MKHKPKANEIIVTIEGATGQIDGYLEILFGVFVFSNTLLGRTRIFRVVKGKRSLLIVKLTLKPAPLGNLGEDDTIDIEEYIPFSEPSEPK